jgi:hypothetical protein
LREALEGQREAFRRKFGRDPGPEEPLFFDENADEPRFMGPEGQAEVEAGLVAAMTEAGIDPAYIYAYSKTGMIVTEANQGQWSEEDLAEWRAAFEEYRSRKRDA